MIQLENVTKTYNGRSLPVHALRDVDLHIAEGEFVAVMGPSGSGKSTLLTVLGAMNPPSQGQVVVDGIDVYGLNVERQADFRHEYVGFVFQQLQLLPYLTAQENVLLSLAIARLPKAEKLARAREALARVGLAGQGGPAALPALGRRAGAGGRGAGHRQPAAAAPGRRADRQPGPGDRRAGAGPAA